MPLTLRDARAALAEVERRAEAQPWARERPWRRKTHVSEEQGVVVVDLHDLKAGLAKQAVRAVVERGEPAAGALIFVVGRGRHSVGPGGVLAKVVRTELGAVTSQRPGQAVRLVGPARLAWITDRRRAPAHVVGGAGWGLPVLWLAILAAVAFAVARSVGWIAP